MTRASTLRTHSPRTTAARRITASAAVAACAALLCAGPAAAHVSVDPDQAEKGGYSVVNFKVPNERDDAATVKLEVNLPADHPLTSVQPQPVPGWDIEVTTSELDEPIEMHGTEIDEAVTRITWSGGEVGPGRFQQFPVSMGRLPEDTDRMVFKALQTYDDGEVVRWIEVPEEGGAEPEHPAPVLRLAAAGGDGGHGGDTPSGGAPRAEAGDDGTRTGAAADRDSTDTTARVLGGLGIVVGLAGIAFGVLAGRRRTS